MFSVTRIVVVILLLLVGRAQASDISTGNGCTNNCTFTGTTTTSTLNTGFITSTGDVLPNVNVTYQSGSSTNAWINTYSQAYNVVDNTTPAVVGVGLLLDTTGATGFTGFLIGDGGVPVVLRGQISTSFNCSSSASPAACANANAGSIVVAAAATTVVVNTTAVTANSQIFIEEDSSLGTKLSVTCNTTNLGHSISARTAATSFTITVTAAPVTNPACFSYFVIN